MERLTVGGATVVLGSVVALACQSGGHTIRDDAPAPPSVGALAASPAASDKVPLIATVRLSKTDTIPYLTRWTPLTADDTGNIYFAPSPGSVERIASTGDILTPAVTMISQPSAEHAEFATLALATADTVLAFDAANKRLVMFAPGTSSSSSTVDLAASKPSRGAIQSIQPVRHGLLVVIVPPTLGGVEAEPREVVNVVTANGMPNADSVLVFRPAHSVTIHANERTYAVYDPFKRAPVVSAIDTTIYFGWTENDTIQVRSLAGKLVGKFILPGERVQVTKADIESAVAAYPNVARRRGFAATLRGDAPHSWPAFTEIVPDGTGNVWVLKGGPESAAQQWFVFSQNGRLIGRAVFETGVSVRAVRGGRAYAITRAPAGGNYVEVYSVTIPHTVK